MLTWNKERPIGTLRHDFPGQRPVDSYLSFGFLDSRLVKDRYHCRSEEERLVQFSSIFEMRNFKNPFPRLIIVFNMGVTFGFAVVIESFDLSAFLQFYGQLCTGIKALAFLRMRIKITLVFTCSFSIFIHINFLFLDADHPINFDISQIYGNQPLNLAVARMFQ